MTEAMPTTPIVGYLVQTAHGARWVPTRSVESISIYEGGSMIFWMRDKEELEAHSNRVMPCRDWPDDTTYAIAIEWARQAEEASKRSRPSDA